VLEPGDGTKKTTGRVDDTPRSRGGGGDEKEYSAMCRDEWSKKKKERKTERLYAEDTRRTGPEVKGGRDRTYPKAQTNSSKKKLHINAKKRRKRGRPIIRREVAHPL